MNHRHNSIQDVCKFWLLATFYRINHSDRNCEGLKVQKNWSFEKFVYYSHFLMTHSVTVKYLSHKGHKNRDIDCCKSKVSKKLPTWCEQQHLCTKQSAGLNYLKTVRKAKSKSQKVISKSFPITICEQFFAKDFSSISVRSFSFDTQIEKDWTNYANRLQKDKKHCFYTDYE